MTKPTSLGDRMKEYERVTTAQRVMRRTPVIIRLDGRAFHTFTKVLKHIDPVVRDGERPFSDIMHDCMTFTMKRLVQDIQGCVLGYTQSDEISLFLRDWDTIDTQSWFNGNVQKMTSISAAIATNAFNFRWNELVPGQRTLDQYAEFDSRAYNLPKEEVCNYFIWRQQDASRNSVQMLGHYHFSQREMHGKNNSQVQDMLMLEKGVNWNNMPTWSKRGSCAYHMYTPVIAHVADIESDHGIKILTDTVMRSSVVVDTEIPIFSGARDFIDKWCDSNE